MPKTTALQPFDYAAFADTDDRQWLREQTAAVMTHLNQAAHHILECGRILCEIKERLGHGNFQRWVQTEFPSGYHTAMRRMHAWKLLSKSARHALFSHDVLSYLCQPGIPSKAREHAVGEAEAGRNVDMARAREIVSAYRSPPRRALQSAMAEADDDDAWPAQATAELLASVVSRGKVTFVEDEDGRLVATVEGSVNDLAADIAVGNSAEEVLRVLLGQRPEKKCSACKQVKPLDAGFGRNSSERDGYHHACRSCESVRQAGVRQRRKRQTGTPPSAS